MTRWTEFPHLHQRVRCTALAMACLASLAMPIDGIAGDADLPPLGTLKPSHPMLIASGQKLAFMGDSITDLGQQMAAGYPRLVIWTLRQYGIDVRPVYAGHGGDQSVDMLKRLDQDVLAAKPDWMTLSCGVNDAWISMRGPKGIIPLDKYQATVTAIVDKCAAAGTKVIILTPTVISGLKSVDSEYQKPYVAWMLQFAAERKLPVADLNAIMREALTHPPLPGAKLGYTSDGIHMNPVGNRMMARGVLQAIGLTKTDLDAVHEAWMDMPKGWTIKPPAGGEWVKLPNGSSQFNDVSPIVAMTPRQYEYLAFNPRGFDMPWYLKEIVPPLLAKEGFASPKEAALSLHFPEFAAKVQAECDRIVTENLAKDKLAYDQFVAGLSVEQKQRMQDAEQ